MNKRVVFHLTWLVCITLALTVSPAGYAQCLGTDNGSFETGTFAGWATGFIGNSAVITTYKDLNFYAPQTVYPALGKYQARLTPDPAAGIDVAALEAGLGVTPGFFANQAMTNGVAIAKLLQLEAGDQISLSYYWVGRDYLPFDDAAFVTILEPSPFPLPSPQITKAKVFQIGSLSQYGSGYLPNYPGAPIDYGLSYGQGSSGYLVWPVASWSRGPQPWAAIGTKGFAYTAPTTGTYLLGVVAFNSEDTVLPPDLLVDNLTCIDPPGMIGPASH
jgi:hypothetical protein